MRHLLILLILLMGCREEKVRKETEWHEAKSVGRTSFGRKYDNTLMPGESMTFEMEIPFE